MPMLICLTKGTSLVDSHRFLLVSRKVKMLIIFLHAKQLLESTFNVGCGTYQCFSVAKKKTIFCIQKLPS